MQLQATNQDAPIACVESSTLERARAFIYEKAGVFYSDHSLLLDRCHHRMSKLGIKSLPEYLEYLTAAAGSLDELKELLNEIALGGAFFYENLSQLEALNDAVIPQILKNKIPGYQFRVWSAGCSTGEEPYSIAIYLMEHAIELFKGHDFQVIATHPELKALDSCMEGVYGSYALRNLPETLLEKYFEPLENGLFRVKDAVRAKINFQKANLLDDSKVVFLKSMDAIFCRNVLKNFSLLSKLHVLQHFHHNLCPNGHLFLGEAETLFGIADDFQLVHFNGATGYRKKIDSK